MEASTKIFQVRKNILILIVNICCSYKQTLIIESTKMYWAKLKKIKEKLEDNLKNIIPFVYLFWNYIFVSFYWQT